MYYCESISIMHKAEKANYWIVCILDFYVSLQKVKVKDIYT